MHPHPRTLAIEIDETTIRQPRLPDQCAPDIEDSLRDRGPAHPLRVTRLIPIPAPVRDPPHAPRRCHAHRHFPPPRGFGRKERSRLRHLSQDPHNCLLPRAIKELFVDMESSDVERFRHAASRFLPAFWKNARFFTFPRTQMLAGAFPPPYIPSEARLTRVGRNRNRGPDAITGSRPGTSP